MGNTNTMATTAATDILKQLAREARSLSGKAEEKETPKVEIKKNNEFTLTLTNYPDVIITREMPRCTRHLVILFSAGSAFVKTERPGGEAKSELLTPELYSEFTSGMDPINLPEGFWTNRIVKGVKFGRKLCELLENEVVCESIRKGWFNRYISYNSELNFNCLEFENIRKISEWIPKLAEEFGDTHKAFCLIKNNPCFVKDIEVKFGIENARDFLRSYEESLIEEISPDFHVGYYIFEHEDPSAGFYCEEKRDRSNLPYLKMKYSAFKDYVLYDAVRFGFGDDFNGFLSDWNDDLRMQWQIYGKIKEKYPDNLQVHHDQLSYKRRKLGDTVDERLFSYYAEKAAKYEGKSNDFIFVAPKTRQDFLDEATAQSNCLAGYIKPFVEGECIILFMRKADTPEKSYITVEIRDGYVNQAKLARNRSINDTEMDILKKWVAKKNAEIKIA